MSTDTDRKKNFIQKFMSTYRDLNPNVKSGINAAALAALMFGGYQAGSKYLPGLLFPRRSRREKENLTENLRKNKMLQYPLYALAAYTGAQSGRKDLPSIGDGIMNMFDFWKPHEYTTPGNRTEAIFKDSSMDTGSYSSFLNQNVPVDFSTKLIAQDDYLIPEEKLVTNHLIHEADHNGSGSGMISGKDITGTAMQAGIDGGSAYVFGNVMGNVFGLPKDLTKRLSAAGGIAAAIKSTGIL